METPPAGRRASYWVEECFAVVVAAVDFPVPLLPVVLPVSLAEPVEPVILPVDVAIASPVLLGDAVWEALGVSLVVLSARTTSVSSSGSHRGQGQAAVKVDRRRMMQ